MMVSMLANNQKTLLGRQLPVAQGCIETLEQGHECLRLLNDSHYIAAAKPHVTSSIGEHFRHILDLFHAIYDAYSSANTATRKPVIDYNHRRRGHKVEESRALAMKELDYFIQWLETLCEQELKATIHLRTEVSITQTETHLMTSTLERELTFAALHANHHYAMTQVTISLMGLNVGDDFGLAPATLSYLRGK
jgi:hypothetical protein